MNTEFKTLRISTVPEEATRLAQLLAKEVDMADLSKAIHDTAINGGMVVFESPLPAVGLTILFQGIYHVSKVNWDPDNDPWALEGEPGRLVREAMNRAIDREPIVNALFKGRGSPMYNTTFHPTLEGWNDRWQDEFDEKYGFDRKTAKHVAPDVPRHRTLNDFATQNANRLRSGRPGGEKLLDILQQCYLPPIIGF